MATTKIADGRVNVLENIGSSSPKHTEFMSAIGGKTGSVQTRQQYQDKRLTRTGTLFLACSIKKFYLYLMLNSKLGDVKIEFKTKVYFLV